MDNQYDGSQMVQKEIPAGGMFTYTLKFPDAGVYWYHPHAGEVVGQALGLYGAFIVEPNNQSYFPKVNEEQTLFLSDIPMVNGMASINANDHALMGHYGNVMLINGAEDYSLSAQQGEVMRLYVINSANVRPFNFTIHGAKMKLVGGDSGAYEKASFTDAVLLAPSERAIIDVYFPDAGDYTLQNKTPDVTYTFGTVKVSTNKVVTSYTQAFNQLQTNQDTITSITPFRKYTTHSPDKRIKLTIDMVGGSSSMGGMMHGGAHIMPNGQMMGGGMMMGGQSEDGIEWEDSGMSMGTTDTVKWKIIDQDTGKENMDIDWKLTKGTPIVIDIYNDPKSMHPMQHPIHFHGQRFLVVSRNGVRQTNLVWKDTVLVKIGETVRIVLDPSNVGEWMAHCHISEHLASGMMFGFSVK
jgi:FtsP/CotA-like multicopper oxidase with cupredoxin domain